MCANTYTLSIQASSTDNLPSTTHPPSTLTGGTKYLQPDPTLIQLYSDIFEEQLLDILNAKFHRNDGHRSLCIEFADELLGCFLCATKYLGATTSEIPESSSTTSFHGSTFQEAKTPIGTTTGRQTSSTSDQIPLRNPSHGDTQLTNGIIPKGMSRVNGDFNQILNGELKIINENGEAYKPTQEEAISFVSSDDMETSSDHRDPRNTSKGSRYDEEIDPLKSLIGNKGYKLTPFIKENEEDHTQPWQVKYPIEDDTSPPEHYAELTTSELIETLKQCYMFERDLVNKLEGVCKDLPRIDQWIRKKRKKELNEDKENQVNHTNPDLSDSSTTEEVRDQIMRHIREIYDEPSSSEQHFIKEEITTPILSSPRVHNSPSMHTSPLKDGMGRHTPMKRRNFVHYKQTMTPISKMRTNTSRHKTHNSNTHSIKELNPNDQKAASHLRRVVTLADVGNLNRLEELRRINQEDINSPKTHTNPQITQPYDKQDTQTYRSDVTDGIVGLKQLTKIYDRILDESNSISNKATFFTQLASEFCGVVDTEW